MRTFTKKGVLYQNLIRNAKATASYAAAPCHKNIYHAIIDVVNVPMLLSSFTEQSES